ncbi:MAG: Pyridinium-3,5-bisthiocarboxylic acid mononucleotide nickel insertion protein [Acidimicrobiales bacterium]|nr:Pyridinium-3,5-bisthiocarboxylic acid mononucleotide nickel insertion protein [Acidimicrobiales bacterium]
MSIAWFHCFSGIAGDMALGALVDAGADLDEVVRMLEALPIGGWSVEAEPVLRGGIAGTKIHVHADESTVVRTAAHIQGLVTEARLPERVQQRALATFLALAQAEGRLHNRPPDQVHFHEVGGIDAIVDVVGTCAALELLEVDRVHSSPVTNGLGMIRSAHGHIPNPSPAVVELLRGAPTTGIDVPVELTTPTGAALLAATVTGWGPMPAMRIDATGFGAGRRELDGRPNLTQVVIGQPADTALVDGQPVTLLEANVDDATGEVLAHALAELLDAGAHDAWITPIVMKKGRPAYTVSALADPALARQVAAVLTSETGSFGVRGLRMERWPSARDVERVVIDGLAVRVKVSPGRVKAELDDAAKLAHRTGRPLREVLSLVESAWRRDHRADDPREGPPPTRPGSGAAVGHLHDDHPDDHAHEHPPPGPGQDDPA